MSSLVVEIPDEPKGSSAHGQKLTKFFNDNKTVICVVAILIIIYMCKDSIKSPFTSPDGVVSRRSRRQVRNDSNFDKSWHIAELEKSVALINRKLQD